MTATFINGTKIGDDIKKEVAAEVEKLKGRGIHPGLAVVLVGDDAASSTYVNMKAKTCEQLGIYSRKLTIPSSVTTDELLSEVQKLNRDEAIDGILVQLPLPKHVNKHAILEGVDPRKDVDGFHSSNVGSLVLGHETLVACTPLGIMELLRRLAVNACERDGNDRPFEDAESLRSRAPGRYTRRSDRQNRDGHRRLGEAGSCCYRRGDKQDFRPCRSPTVVWR